jgi:hypothetical protein
LLSLNCARSHACSDAHTAGKGSGVSEGVELGRPLCLAASRKSSRSV